MEGPLSVSPRKLYILILCTLAVICIVDAGLLIGLTIEPYRHLTLLTESIGGVSSKIEGNQVRGRHLLQVASGARDATGRRFCSLNDEGECDWNDYGQVIPISSP